MSIPVIRQTSGAFHSFSSVSSATLDNSSSPFSSSTLLDNTLICVVLVSDLLNTGAVPIPTINTPTTPGLTWTLINGIGNEGVFTGIKTYGSAVAIYVCANAPALATTTHTSVTVTTAPTTCNTLAVQIELYEMTGLAGTVDTSATGTGTGTPSAHTANLVTSATDFILVASYTADGSYFAPGSGYTGYTIQYILSQAAGSIPTLFGVSSDGPGGSPYWSCVAVAFHTPNPVPTITSIVSNSGPSSGGASVTITGTNFTSGVIVSFGGVAATDVVVVSLTEITCVTPVHFPETVNVIVQESAGTATLTNGYTYVSSKIPVLYNFQDASGNPLSYGTVTFRLNTDAMTINGQQISAGILTSFTLDVNGNLVGFLWPSDQMTSDAISPDTTYRVRAYTADGQLAYEEDLVVLTP